MQLEVGVNKTREFTYSHISSGDAAVDGLFSGAQAGILMAAYIFGVGTLLDPQIGEAFSRLITGQGLTISGVLLLHMAISSIYGLLYSLACNIFIRPLKRAPSTWLAALVGISYAGLLFLFANLLILPGAGAAQSGIPVVHSAIAHLIYGIVLGVQVFRSRVKKGE